VIQQFIDTAPDRQLKFVVSDEKDLDEIEEILGQLDRLVGSRRAAHARRHDDRRPPIPRRLDRPGLQGSRLSATAPRLHVELYGTPAARRLIRRLMNVQLSKTFHFEAAHDLPTFPPDHKCRRLHGHSFRVRRSFVEGAGRSRQGVPDRLRRHQEGRRIPLVKRLDHYYLNEIDGFVEPDERSASRSGCSIRLKTTLPQLSAIIVYENLHEPLRISRAANPA
jgi:6-pyruvoyltetrahydropterin/6-carboxytetrahydropterin synthase